MISKENSDFLKDRFQINIDDYTEEELNKILDEIIKILKKEIDEKAEKLNELEIDLMNESEE